MMLLRWLGSFCGQQLTTFITHIDLGPYPPQKNKVKSFLDIRPICLRIFMNKVISILVHDRMKSCYHLQYQRTI